MPEDVTKKLQDRKEAIKKEFEVLQETRKGFIEENKALQAKLNDVDAKLVQKQGAYAEIESLLAEPEKKVPTKK